MSLSKSLRPICWALGLLVVAVIVFGSSQAAQAGPVDWFCWVGQQLGPGIADGRPDTSFNGSTDALDPRNWYRQGAWAPDIATVQATYGSRWGFTGAGGWGETGSTGMAGWFTGSPSIYYPSVANPATAIIGAGQALNFPTNTSGSISGDMHVQINGGTLTAGEITDNTYYGAWLRGFDPLAGGAGTYTAYQWKNTIDVSNGGVFTATNVYGFFQGGAPSAGHLTLGVHGAATVNLTKYAAGHTGVGAPGTSDGSNAPNNGLGGGGLTLEGSGATINITNLLFFPSNPATLTGRNAFSEGAKLTLLLDETVSDRVFNTVTANVLQIDPTYVMDGGTNLNSPVNLVVTLDGYSPVTGDVIPVVTANTIQKYDGTSVVGGSLGGVTVNGGVVAWGSEFGMGTFDPETEEWQYRMRLLDHDPENVSQKGVYLEITQGEVPEPGTMVLLALGALGALVMYRRRAR